MEKFCTDCKHYQPPAHPAQQYISRKRTVGCNHPQNLAGRLVDGIGEPLHTAIWMREEGRLCGPEATLFDAVAEAQPAGERDK